MAPVRSMATPVSSPLPITIRGGGAAAHCCAGLLRQAGIAVVHDAPPPAQAPAILLGEGAVNLLRQCFRAPQLLAGARRINRRVVSWNASEPSVLPHEALVLSGGELHEALHRALDAIETPADAVVSELAGGYTVHAGTPPADMPLRTFGQRRASAVPVRLHHGEDESACWIEAVDEGWLFMIPSAPGEGWLLAVGNAADVLLASSRHLASRVTVLPGETARFETAPRMIEALAGPGWLACGTEALAFDPLCGDGTAQAVREAFLGVAVLRAIAESGTDEDSIARYRDHYHAMLLAGMRRHLRQCAQFYASGGRSPWWQAQLEATRRGFDWCSAQLASFPEPRYRLDGLTLTAIETAA